MNQGQQDNRKKEEYVSATTTSNKAQSKVAKLLFSSNRDCFFCLQISFTACSSPTDKQIYLFSIYIGKYICIYVYTIYIVFCLRRIKCKIKQELCFALSSKTQKLCCFVRLQQRFLLSVAQAGSFYFTFCCCCCCWQTVVDFFMLNFSIFRCYFFFSFIYLFNFLINFVFSFIQKYISCCWCGCCCYCCASTLASAIWTF